MIKKLWNIFTFTLSPAICAWFLTDIIYNNEVKTSHWYTPQWLDWILFLTFGIITIGGYVVDLKNACFHSYRRQYIRRKDTGRVITGRRHTDK